MYPRLLPCQTEYCVTPSAIAQMWPMRHRPEPCLESPRSVPLRDRAGPRSWNGHPSSVSCPSPTVTAPTPARWAMSVRRANPAGRAPGGSPSPVRTASCGCSWSCPPTKDWGTTAAVQIDTTRNRPEIRLTGRLPYLHGAANPNGTCNSVCTGSKFS